MLCIRPIRTDAVFPEFDRALHVTSEDPHPGISLGGMDFGMRSPTVFLWAVLEPSGRLAIVDEHHESNQTLHHHIECIKASRNERPEWVGADPSGNNRNDQTARSNVALLEAAGFPVRTRRMSIAESVPLIRARLQAADLAPPTLVIHKRCTRLIESLEQYHYDQERPLAIEPVKDGPDHAIDALRYLIANLDAPYQFKSGEYAA